MNELIFRHPYIFFGILIGIGFLISYFMYKNEVKLEKLKPPRTYEGEVYEKIFHPEKEETTFLPLPIGKTIGLIPRIKQIPACWEIRIRKWDQKTSRYHKNECFVSEEVANHYQIGDHFKTWSHEVEYNRT